MAHDPGGEARLNTKLFDYVGGPPARTAELAQSLAAAQRTVEAFQQGPGLQSLARDVERAQRTVEAFQQGPGLQSLARDVERAQRTVEAFQQGPGLQSLARDVERAQRTVEAFQQGPGLQSLARDAEFAQRTVKAFDRTMFDRVAEAIDSARLGRVDVALGLSARAYEDILSSVAVSSSLQDAWRRRDPFNLSVLGRETQDAAETVLRSALLDPEETLQALEDAVDVDLSEASAAVEVPATPGELELGWESRVLTEPPGEAAPPVTADDLARMLRDLDEVLTRFGAQQQDAAMGQREAAGQQRAAAAGQEAAADQLSGAQSESRLVTFDRAVDLAQLLVTIAVLYFTLFPLATSSPSVIAPGTRAPAKSAHASHPASHPSAGVRTGDRPGHRVTGEPPKAHEDRLSTPPGAPEVDSPGG